VLLGAGPVVLVEVGTGPRADDRPPVISAARGLTPWPRRRPSAAPWDRPRPLRAAASPPNPHKPHVRRSGGVLRVPDRAGRVARATTRVVSHAIDVPWWLRRGWSGRGGVQPRAEWM